MSYSLVYDIGFIVWWAWELSSWPEYENKMSFSLFFVATIVSAIFWPVSSLADLFAYLRYPNDTP